MTQEKTNFRITVDMLGEEASIDDAIMMSIILERECDRYYFIISNESDYQTLSDDEKENFDIIWEKALEEIAKSKGEVKC